MLLLTSTSDIVRVVTGSAGAVDVHASWVDNASGTITPGRTNTASIVTATTTTVVAAPGASTQRNVRQLCISNDSASVSNLVTVEHFDGTTAETLWKGTLAPGERVIFDENGLWTPYTANGGIKADAGGKIYNASVANQTGFAADTYLSGSFIQFPSATRAGTRYWCVFDMVKTGAGTATPIIIVRVGTAGTTADTARITFTFNAGTANADTGTFELIVTFRAGGATATLAGVASLRKGATATTGLVNLVGQTVTGTAASFDSTPTNTGIGISFNGGASFSGTNVLVAAALENF